MANEPERPIEKLLRAAAKKRRDEAGAPFELHPADRRLLQGEVARQFASRAAREPLALIEVVWDNCGRGSPGPSPSWPSLGWRCGSLVPVPGRNEQTALLARNEPTKEPSQAVEPPRRLPAAPQPIGKDSFAAKLDDSARDQLAISPQLADRRKAAEAQGTAPGSLPAPPPAIEAPTAPAVAFAAKPASAAAEESGTSSPAYQSLAAVASASRPGPASAATDGLAMSTASALKEAKSAGVVQRFVQVAPRRHDRGPVRG